MTVLLEYIDLPNMNGDIKKHLGGAPCPLLHHR